MTGLFSIGRTFAILRKDTLVFLREGRLGLRIVTTAVTTLMVIGLVFTRRPASEGSPALLVLFLIASEAGMLVIPSEGKGMVWAAASPMSPRVFVLAKLGTALVFTAIAATVPILILGLSHGWTAEAWTTASIGLP